MKVLLTGSTGLIGREIGKRLVARGDQVVTLVRDLDRARRTEPFPAERYLWNHVDEVPAEALLGVDAVIHLAGEPIADGRWTAERKQKIRDSRIVSSRRLVQAVLKHGSSVEAFVQGSAIGIYGDRGDEVLNAASTGGSGFLPEVVRDWEAEIKALSPTVRSVVIRTGVVLARHGGALEKMLSLFRLGLGARLGFAGSQWMSWIHLEDIVSLFLYALDQRHVSGVLEGVSPEPLRNRDFTSRLTRGLGVIESPPVPQLTLKLLYGEMASIILESARVEPKSTQAAGFQFQFASAEAAFRDLLEPLRGQTCEVLAEQWVPQTPQTIWPYFCDEKNLEELTPSNLKFRVVGKSTPEISEGTLIDYRLSLSGVPFGWRTKIESWQPPSRFIDNQIQGPYAYWHHTHEFIPMGGGTLMRDRVYYRLPLGWLGTVAAGWKVASDVAAIFAYRRLKVDQLFHV
ncbi:MAG: TIGR01777 family oxidoreductase [Bdellovibrionaceae bacterium]|nr:TIGR01777 family oxidoreductase [Pseudobdellovibrionaceae bacterium]